MKKFICWLIVVFTLLFSFSTVAFAAEKTETLNVVEFENRYTDISEFEDLNNPYLEAAKENDKSDEKRMVYIIVLVVLLIIAVGVFIYTLRKVPDEETFEKNEKEKLESNSDSADSSEG